MALLCAVCEYKYVRLSSSQRESILSLIRHGMHATCIDWIFDPVDSP